MDVGEKTNQLRALASRIGVSDTIPEPERDIEAQLRALNDPRHPKTTVFLARGTPLGTRRLAANVRVITRTEGTLLTTDKKRAAYYGSQTMITDADLAYLLGYPEAKADVLAEGDGVVVQARDADGCVITEALASPRRASETLRALERHVPFCGQLIVLTPASALSRRLHGGQI